MNTTADSAHALLHAADRCVLCGMCLPHCPTFRLTGNEGESPRGRIALAQALARGQLQADAPLAEHLDHCLSCLACEAACPSGVQYTTVLGQARRLLAQQRPPAPRWRLAAELVSRPAVLGAGVRLGAFVRPLSKVLQAAIPAKRSDYRPPAFTPAAGTERGRVGLFLGCTGKAFDGAALEATVKLLSHLGFAVVAPEHQGCCGALHHGLGNQRGFEARARRNLAAFPTDLDAVISIASGCAAMLAAYDRWLDSEQAARFAPRVREIASFLADQAWPDQASPAPLTARVAVHVPCSQSNALQRPDAAARLLARIPQLTVVPLATTGCCGAAGMHMLREPDTAARLRAPAMDALSASGARYLATTNVGCALHLHAGITEGAQQVETLHPVTLLWRQVQTRLAAAGQTR